MYMVVNRRNATHCFDALILTEKWDKLNGMKQTNGVSYPEELYELQWTIEERNGKKESIYQDIFPVID